MSLYVIIRQRHGWTRRLLTYNTSLKGRAAWLEGPFGQSYGLQEYGTVLMFASGDGIFAQLPFIKSLAELFKISAVKTRRIKLIWQTEEYHNHRLKVIRDVPDVETYVQLEMKEPQRNVAVTGTCFPGILVTNADIS